MRLGYIFKVDMFRTLPMKQTQTHIACIGMSHSKTFVEDPVNKVSYLELLRIIGSSPARSRTIPLQICLQMGFYFCSRAACLCRDRLLTQKLLRSRPPLQNSLHASDGSRFLEYSSSVSVFWIAGPGCQSLIPHGLKRAPGLSIGLIFSAARTSRLGKH